MHRYAPALLVLAALAAAPRSVAAQQASRDATLTASVDAMARLSLSSLTLAFADADPDTVPQIPSSTGPIVVEAKARAFQGESITLTVVAADDLRSGTDVIPASALSWTASGTGFVNGTLAAGIAQTVGTWTNSGVHAGTLTWVLANSWTYAPGTYSLTLTCTLTAP